MEPSGRFLYYRFLHRARESIVNYPTARLLRICCLGAALWGAAPGQSRANSTIRWRELGSPARSAHVVVWDRRHERAILLGGQLNAPMPGVWQMLPQPRPHWELLATSGVEPVPRAGSCAVYDSAGDRVLVFRGAGVQPGVGSGELWELSL